MVLILMFSCPIFTDKQADEFEDESDQTPAKWSDQLKITASDADTGDYFGYSVAASGDYVIVGAFWEDGSGFERGAAYIYHRIDISTWDAGTKITAPDAEDGDTFGSSVAISGDYAVVGAYLENESGGNNSGAAYIFRRTGINSWDSGTKIKASDAADHDMFGLSVSISGDYVVVGALTEDGTGTDRGAAYIFKRTGTNSWDSGVKIIASDSADDDNFGCSVSISEEYTIIGSQYEDGIGSNRGAAYIFRRPGSANVWDAGTKITASDATDYDYFGCSVSISGELAIVGAKGGGLGRGVAYIFRRTGTNTWDNYTKITASDATFGDYFGCSVSISGDNAVVGAHWKTNKGAAYVFRRIGTNLWNIGTKIIASDADIDDYFGYSVAVSGDYAIVGACYEDGAGVDIGAAYIFK